MKKLDLDRLDVRSFTVKIADNRSIKGGAFAVRGHDDTPPPIAPFFWDTAACPPHLAGDDPVRR